MDENELRARLREAAVVPILTVTEPEKSHADADRMVEAGAGAIEILFRTAPAPQFLSEARRRHPGCLFGADDSIEPAERMLEPGDDEFLFRQGPARGLSKIRFGDWRVALDHFSEVPNVARFT